MRTNLYLLLFLLGSIAGVAQTEIIELRGAITNNADVEGIHILNTTSRYNTVTNETGNFSVNARLADTLVVSSIRYMPQQVVVTPEILESGTIVLTLEELVNQLEEVVLGPRLSGNIEQDLKDIKTKKQLNFYDVGIPGFVGKHEERIIPAYTLSSPTAVDIEAIYNHLSGYYKKLKLRRKWEAQNNTVAYILNTYSRGFFDDAYGIPENRVYDFLLFCIETTRVQHAFNKGDYADVIAIFEVKAPEYVSRLEPESEPKKKEE